MSKKIKVEEKEVGVKSEKRSIVVKNNREGHNLVIIKSLTADFGKENAVKFFLSEDDLIKNTIIPFSDDAIIDLTQALLLYSQKVLGAKVE